jgi:chemotaxis protein MotB
MAVKARKNDSDEGTGAPEWMVTFSDCMTLLLTFFVLLLSFSSFDEKSFTKLESAFAERLPSIGVLPVRKHDGFRPTPRIIQDMERDKGSEKPTEDGRYESNPNESLDFLEFQNQKVLLAPSDKVFWGRGTLMSPHGQRLLADIASLIQAVPNRVVVSEHGLEPGGDGGDIGVERAWTVARFLNDCHGLDKTRFCISSAGTVAEEALRQSGLFASNPRSSRVIEIIILDRSLYH